MQPVCHRGIVTGFDGDRNSREIGVNLAVVGFKEKTIFTVKIGIRYIAHVCGTAAQRAVLRQRDQYIAQRITVTVTAPQRSCKRSIFRCDKVKVFRFGKCIAGLFSFDRYLHTIHVGRAVSRLCFKQNLMHPHPEIGQFALSGACQRSVTLFPDKFCKSFLSVQRCRPQCDRLAFKHVLIITRHHDRGIFHPFDNFGIFPVWALFHAAIVRFMRDTCPSATR